MLENVGLLQALTFEEDATAFFRTLGDFEEDTCVMISWEICLFNRSVGDIEAGPSNPFSSVSSLSSFELLSRSRWHSPQDSMSDL